MFILFKVAVLVAVGLVLTQQAAHFMENRARTAHGVISPAAPAATTSQIAFH